MSSQSNNSVPLYFAFPDGVYHYVCAECTALCCKGGGLGGSLKREFRSLFVLYPQVESLAVSRDGDSVSFVNTVDGCAFLDADNRCRIEKEHGKALKPSVCSIFPFNNLRKIGKTVVVTPHFLCPLRLILPASPGEVQGTHSAIEASIRDSELLSKEHVRSLSRPLFMHPSTDAVLAIDQERKFRDLCSVSLGRQSFSDTLKKASHDGAALEKFVGRAARVMGIEVPPKSQPRDHLDDLLLAIAPPYRSSMLGLASEQMLRALAVAELTLRRACSLAKLPINLQGVMQMASTFGPTQRLLAYGDEPFDFVTHISKKELAFGDPQLTFAAYLFQRQGDGPAGVLSTLEEAILPEMPVSDRSVLFQRLGNLVDQKRSKLEKQKAIKDKMVSA